jgi:N utilization substance protein B
MSARRKARKRALDILFEADLRKVKPLSILIDRPADQLSAGDYVEVLINGVSAHREKIDELIHTYAEGWDMDRMPAIDRNLLRIALFEILWQPELNDQIAVSEAVDIAQELSTKDSAGYINGILGRVITLKDLITL